MNSKTTIILIIFLLAALLLASCTKEQRFEDQLDKAINEEFSYKTFTLKDFSVDYPDWEMKYNEGVELSVSRGYCSVAINSETLKAKQWYDMIAEAVEQQKGEILIANDKDMHVKFSALYQNISLISDNQIFDCNGNAVAVTVMCMESASEKTKDINERVFSSAKCDGKLIKEVKVDDNDAKEETTNKEEPEATEFKTFREDDFKAAIPVWNKLEDNGDHLAAVSKGVCSVLIDRHNALPEDIINWIETAINENKDQKLIESRNNKIVYEMPYEDNTVTSTMDIRYCNYQSYITQVLCVNELITEEYKDIRDTIIDSADCTRTYTPPNKEALEERKETIIEEEPEAIGEIEDEIVKTNAGEEFGIDEELVVYFINNNAFFTKIMKDFPAANMIIHDDANNKELKLKAAIGSDGKITSLEDGQHSSPDITLKIPLKDALNIFGNAENLNPLNLLAFAVNVETVPKEVKNEVIQKALRGEYN